MNTVQWYLEVNGRKIGPFSLDQIQGLLADGEIRPFHQVSPSDDPNRWMSVEDLLASNSPPPPPVSDSGPISLKPTVQKNSGNFQPPPRPKIQAQLNDVASEYSEEDDKLDPATGLFDALQILRERKAAAIQPPTVKDRKRLLRMAKVAISKGVGKENLRALFKDEARTWTLSILAGFILAGISWGVFSYLKTKNTPTQTGTLTQVSSLKSLNSTPSAANSPPPQNSRSNNSFSKPIVPPPAANPAIRISRPGFHNASDQAPPSAPPPANAGAPQPNNYPEPYQDPAYNAQQQEYQYQQQQAQPQLQQQQLPQQQPFAQPGELNGIQQPNPIQQVDPNNPNAAYPQNPQEQMGAYPQGGAPIGAPGQDQFTQPVQVQPQ